MEGLEEAGSNGCCFLPFPQSVVGSLISSGVYSALELSPSWEWLGGEPGGGERSVPGQPP